MIFDVEGKQDIMEKHNDGGCFKLTLVYTDYLDSVPFEPHIVYSEDFMSLLVYGKHVYNHLEDNGKYTIDFRIQDDSK